MTASAPGLGLSPVGEPAKVLEQPAPRKTTERGPTVSVLAKIKARNLYLSQGLSVPGVAEACGLSLSVVRKWAEKEGWAAERKACYSRLVAKQDAQRGAVQTVVLEAIAAHSEEHALSAMRNVGEALQRSDKDAAKDFQAYTAGVKNLASTARMLREPISANAGEGTQITANFFFAPPPVKAPEQVTDIEAKSVQ